MTHGRRLPLVLTAIALLAAYGLISLQAEWRPSYDAKQSYAYSFPEPPARRVSVSLADAGFTLPPTSEPWDTAFMRLQLAATLPGKWFAPSIEVQVNGSRIAMQYFEPGAEGVRYIDLSALAGFPRDSPRVVSLHGSHVTWKPQSSELLFFDNRLPAKPRVMVVAPHPDDAEIAAFGLYSQHESRIVTVTAGDSGGRWYEHILPDDAQHFAMKARLRVWDSIVVPQLGGVKPEHALNLGYFDGTLERMFARPQEEVRARYVDTNDVMTFRRHNVADLSALGKPRATWENLVSDLTKLFADGRPDVIVAPHPVLDGHPDHAFTGIAVLEAVAAANLSAAKLYLYGAQVAHADEFPFGPAISTVGMPPWFDPKIPFHGLHSVPLSRERQVFKLFVLDSMHDFRRGPPGLDPSLGENARSTLASLRRLVTDLAGGDATSYYRKAARPNELFFVYAGREACALHAIFLEAIGVKATRRCGTEIRPNVGADNGPANARRH